MHKITPRQWQEKLDKSKEKAAQNRDTSPKQKGWSTPYGFADFNEPVTYNEACRHMKDMRDLIATKYGVKS